jgi:hypothetical protein
MTISYRCFLVGADGRLADLSFEDLATDDDAVTWAHFRLDTYPGSRTAELWRDNHVVQTISREECQLGDGQ